MSSLAADTQSSQSLLSAEETGWTNFNCDQFLDTTMFDNFLLEEEDIDFRNFKLSGVGAPDKNTNLGSGVPSSIEPQAASSISSTTSLPNVVEDVTDNYQDVAAATTVAEQTNLDVEHAPSLIYSSDTTCGSENGPSNSMGAFHQTPRYMPFAQTSHPGHSVGRPTARPGYIPFTPPPNQGYGIKYPISPPMSYGMKYLVSPPMSYGMGFHPSALQARKQCESGSFLSPRGNAGAPFAYPPPPGALREFQYSCSPPQPWGSAPSANMIAQHNFSSMTPPGRQVSSINTSLLDHGNIGPPGAPRKFRDYERLNQVDFATSPTLDSRKRAYNGNFNAAKKPRSCPNFEGSKEMGFDAPPNTVNLGPKGAEPKEVKERLMNDIKTKRCSYVIQADSQHQQPTKQSSPQLKPYARRTRNPGRQISIPQTPEVIKRNAARREHYRNKLTPQQRRTYDRNAAITRGQAINV